jgi:pimeloyl-ACP methyl ester carboxylesterase
VGVQSHKPKAMKQAIIIIGGYNSFWTGYLGLARDLEELTGLQAIGVPLMPWYWWTAERAQEATNILQKVRETVIWARRRFQAGEFVLVGHSAGGLIARLYLCEEPVWGESYAGREHVRTVITLGSPHCPERGAETGWFLADEANRLAPGTACSNGVRFRTVGGRYLQGREDGSWQERRAYRNYRFFAGQGRVWGDGTVPVESSRLEGVEALVLDGIAHSRRYGPGWYGGSKEIIRRWWPGEEIRAG